MDKAGQDNRGNQLNPNNPQYGGGPKANDNHGNQLNPNNPQHGGGRKQ